MHAATVMLMPAVSRYMTAHPLTIDRGATMGEAHRVMRAHQVRHLPVVDQGRLVGVVTQRDLYLLETIADFDLDGVTVAEAMTEQPYVVTSDAPLDEVVSVMAEKRYGSAIVMGRAGVEGIFTGTDVCRALADILERETSPRAS